MNDYTPTTEEVRSAYHYYGKYPELAPDDNTVTGAEFARWLRQVKAEAWAEGAFAGWIDRDSELDNVRTTRTPNPYLNRDNR